MLMLFPAQLALSEVILPDHCHQVLHLPPNHLLAQVVSILPREWRGDQLVASGILLFDCLEDGPNACLFQVLVNFPSLS